MTVDEILDGWFGEPVEHAEDDRKKYLYEPLRKIQRQLIDRDYMIRALVDMLGPKGKEVWNMYMNKGVIRVHFNWGPEKENMTGEEIAQFILDLENTPKTPMKDL